MAKKNYLGFGFGPIQAGLFLREAVHSGNFNRMVIVEIQTEIVQALRKDRGNFFINVAYRDHIEQEEIGPIEIYNPKISKEREQIVMAFAEADEISTAIPSISFYKTKGHESIDRIIAEGIKLKKEITGPDCVIYTAENHNNAAEILQEHILNLLSVPDREWAENHVHFLNTVIGKMGHVVLSPAEIKEKELTTLTKELDTAFLVESFNQILVSKITHPCALQRGIQVFEEKQDLPLFKEAKLFGHNAVHALIGYTGKSLGSHFVSDVQNVPGYLPFIRDALIKESGYALIKKYKNRAPLFTEKGWRIYADDLIVRMMNPYLDDRIDRITRDPERKLGWNDRLVGTMRLALSKEIIPFRYAFGVAAAIDSLLQNEKTSKSIHIEDILVKIWGQSQRKRDEESRVIQSIKFARNQYYNWLESGQPNLSEFLTEY